MGQQKKETRRTFIKNTAVGVVGVAIGHYIFQPKEVFGNEEDQLVIRLDEPKNKPLKSIGGVLALEGNELDRKGLLLYRASESDVRIFSRRCPHRGCQLETFQDDVSVCPCHDARFNLLGEVISGPTKENLRQYKAIIDGDQIIVLSK